MRRSTISLDQRIANIALQNLARSVARKRLGCDFDNARDFERGQLRRKMNTQNFDIDAASLLGQNSTGHFFAKSFVRHPEDRRFVHVIELVDDRFDFSAVDVLASAQHHVLHAIFYEDVAFLVDPSEIATSKPTVDDRLGRCLRLVPVAADQVRALEAEFAGLSSGEGFISSSKALTSSVGTLRPVLRGLRM